jgi:hypothetical protein
VSSDDRPASVEAEKDVSLAAAQAGPRLATVAVTRKGELVALADAT